MKTNETETQEERIHRTAHNLTVLVKDQKARVLESKQRCLKAMEVLQVYPDFFCHDFNEQLGQEKKILLDGLALDVLDAREAADEQPDEQKLRVSETIDCILRNMQLHLGVYTPTLQRDILLFLLSELPDKLQEQQEEQELEEARSELINIVEELPHGEKISAYKHFSEQVRNHEEVLVVA